MLWMIEVLYDTKTSQNLHFKSQDTEEHCCKNDFEEVNCVPTKKPPIDFKRVRFCAAFKSLTENKLKDISCLNVLLHLQAGKQTHHFIHNAMIACEKKTRPMN